jgi:ABC-type amino acid transport substrate-binding protein
MDICMQITSRFLVAFAVLAAGAAQGRTLMEIRSTGELRVCVAGSSADFYQANAQELARHLGVTARIKTLPNWDAQFVDAQGVVRRDARYEAAPLATGHCDLYPNDLHITPWREQKMVLVPYFSTRSVVVARPQARATLRGPEDLAGRTAAVQAGTAYETWLRAWNAQAKDEPITIRLMDTASAMQAVAERRADFTVIAAESALKWVRDDLDNLDLLFPVGDVTQVGWGISPHTPDLEQALREFFSQSRRVGSGLDLSWRRKYGVSLMEYQLFSASIDTGHRWRDLLVTWGIPAGSALGGLLLAVAFWARRLRREVARHRVAAQALLKSQAQMRIEVRRGQAVSDLLRGLQLVNSLEAFGEVTLRELSHHLPLGQALIAMVDERDQGLRALAHRAGTAATPSQALAKFPVTAGLMARCAATAEPVLVESPGPDYLRIQSGLGDCAPAAILLVPIRHAGQVVAVIEMATTRPVEPEHQDLLAALEPIVATGIHRLHKEAALSTPQQTVSVQSQEA